MGEQWNSVKTFEKRGAENKMTTALAIVGVVTIIGAIIFVAGIYLQRQRQQRYRTLNNPGVFNRSLSGMSEFSDGGSIISNRNPTTTTNNNSSGIPDLNLELRR